jgi:hypothetical protein
MITVISVAFPILVALLLIGCIRGAGKAVAKRKAKVVQHDEYLTVLDRPLQYNQGRLKIDFHWEEEHDMLFTFEFSPTHPSYSTVWNLKKGDKIKGEYIESSIKGISAYEPTAYLLLDAGSLQPSTLKESLAAD